MKDRPWLAHYPPGVPHSIEPLAYASLIEMIDDACSRFETRSAFGNLGCYLTFGEIRQQSIDFAAFLQCSGISPGDRVAIMLPNTLAYPVAMLGALRVGATVVNVNPQYTVRELHHQLRDSGASLIVALRHLRPTVERASEDTGIKRIVVAEIGDLFPLWKRHLVNAMVRRMTPPAPAPAMLETIPFMRALKSGSERKLGEVNIAAEDLAFLQYTGGTTGVSKGAMLSHRNVVANVMQLSAFFTGHTDPDGDVIITALPLYHIFALTFNCFGFMLNGGTNYLITDPRNIKNFIKELKRVRFSAINGVNTLFDALHADEAIKGVDFSHLKYSGSGGTATQTTTAENWQALTDTVIAEGYGLTEASPAVCANPVGLTTFTGTVGFPVPSTDCSIRDDSGHPLPVNSAGELWVKGPQVMRGYWQAPQETAAVLTGDGWLRTGDIATMGEDGSIRIVDRKKDIIVVSGFNVYPNEIEEVVTAHPAVREAAAIGVSDPRSGEAVQLVLVADRNALNAEQLEAFCRERLAAYKVPRSFTFVDELPKSTVGKILRQRVREQYG